MGLKTILIEESLGNNDDEMAPFENFEMIPSLDKFNRVNGGYVYIGRKRTEYKISNL